MTNSNLSIKPGLVQVVAEKDAFITELKDLIGKLEGQVQDYRRTKFGRKSEKLDPAQLELADACLAQSGTSRQPKPKPKRTSMHRATCSIWSREMKL